jgi:ABC-2 type transport system ATP-binding protein
MSQAPPIECRDLTRFYGRNRGIEGLDLIVEPGSVTGFLGPNGAGKTTVIRLLVGLLHPTRGGARLFGGKPHDPETRSRLGYLPADPTFYGDLTGTQNLDLLADIGGWDSPHRAWACELLDLDPAALARPVRGYSSGMVQKLGLVQAIQHAPDLVILDEPANRLDPIAHSRFVDLVRRIAAEGRTVFLSSHTLSEVEEVCQRVAMVRDGRLLLTTGVSELTARALRVVTVRYRKKVTAKMLPPELLDRRLDGRVVTGRLEPNRSDVLRALLADPSVEDLLVEPASLEDAVLHLYEREPDGTSR